jgi:hypothetical protein
MPCRAGFDGRAALFASGFERVNLPRGEAGLLKSQSIFECLQNV